MDDKTLVERCSICGCQLDAPADPTSRNCGGDCLSCMALVAEDPACMGAYIEFQTTRIEALEAEKRKSVLDLLAVLGQYADTIEAQATRIEALEAALRFYARENSWKSCGVYMCGHSQPSSAEVDRGNKARKALESQP